MLGAFAEFQREVIIDRVINGMERKAAKGEWTHGLRPSAACWPLASHHRAIIPGDGVHGEFVVLGVIGGSRRPGSSSAGQRPPDPL
jgi:hypothetical protein